MTAGLPTTGCIQHGIGGGGGGDGEADGGGGGQTAPVFQLEYFATNFELSDHDS